jgi:AraC-like DNA-binding protein
MDVLSDVLRAIRLEGALFFTGEFHEPWSVDVPSGAELARKLREGTRQLAVVHLVLEGRCWVKLADGSTLALAAGDIVVLPHGHSHLLGSGRGHAPVSIDDAIDIEGPELQVVRYGGDGAETHVACGWFAFERGAANPLTTSLPAMFSTSIAQRRSGAWLQQSIRYAAAEAATQSPGSVVVAAKVAEALFVEALRGYIEALDPSQTGWLAGLRDPHVGRCLALLHEAPAHPWTIAELAKRTHTSRSVLALRFTELLGMPPMQYLKRWRLTMAARLLRDEQENLARVAEHIGYESEAAFSRAFKREHGVSPGLWRRQAVRA